MRNRAWLARHGLLYPVTMRAPHPTASQHRYLNSYMRQQFATGGKGTAALDTLAEEILEHPSRAALISEEQFSYESFRAAPWLAQLRGWFDCKVLLTLRRPDRWTESMYAQAVRGGYKPDFAAFLDASATRERLDHTGLRAIWAESFGDANVIALHHPETDGDSTGRLLGALGLPAPDAFPDRFNPSLPGEAIAFLRQLDLPPELYPAFNRTYSVRLATMVSPAPFAGFSAPARRAFLTRWSGAPSVGRLDNGTSSPTPAELPSWRQRQILLGLLDLPDRGQPLAEISSQLARACAGGMAA